MPRRRSRTPEACPASEWFDDRRPERELNATTDVPEHRRLAEDALWSLTQPTPGALLPALPRAMREWLVADRPRGAAGHRRALRPDGPLDPDCWTLAFAGSLERETADGLAILRRLEHAWRGAHAAIGARPSTGRLHAAVDLLAATPLLGPARPGWPACSAALSAAPE